MSSQRTIDLLMHAGAITPTTVTKEKQRHKRANYKEDIKPFASGIGWAAAITTAGIIIASAALATLISQSAGWVRDNQTLLVPETYILAGSAAAAAYGIAYALQMRELIDVFIDRLYNREQERTHFTTTTTNPEKEPAVFLHVGHGRDTRIPSSIPNQSLTNYANALINGTAALSEAGALKYGIRSNGWNDFKTWAMVNGFIRWKDPANHRQGLEIAGAGGRAAINTIALGIYNETPS